MWREKKSITNQLKLKYARISIRKHSPSDIIAKIIAQITNAKYLTLCRNAFQYLIVISLLPLAFRFVVSILSLLRLLFASGWKILSCVVFQVLMPSIFFYDFTEIKTSTVRKLEHIRMFSI